MNRKWVQIIIAVVGCLAFTLGTISADSRMTTREYFEKWDNHFKDLTEMRAGTANTSGTGFKPYQRFKWFFERRLSPDGNMIPGVRWKAYDQLQEMVNEKGRDGETWFTLGPINVAGRCLAIEVHPTNSDIVYAGFASGGIWMTTDSGSNWAPLGDDLPTMAVSAIEIDSNNPDRIWIGTGEGWGNTDAVHGAGLLRSLDGGLTWGTTGFNYSVSSGLDVFELEYNPATGTLLLAAENGLWRSTDGGDSFDEVMPSGKWMDVQLKKGSTDTIFACSYYWAEMGFWRSTDDGLTWTRCTTGVPTAGLSNMRLALCDAYPDIIYWAIANGSGGMLGIWRSVDGGDSFAQEYSGSPNHYGTQGWYNLTIAVDPTNPNRVMSGGVEFYRSTNGGTSFSQIASNVHVDHHATAWDPSNPAIFWVGSDGGVYRSANSGVSYSNKNLGLVTMQFYAMNHSKTLPTRALGGTQDNGTYIFNDNPNWGSILGGDGFFCEVDYADPNYVYAELYFGDHRRSST
ncbi:MAG: hypothetical protein KJ927_02475, partial [Candidatus Eisenbacteria bacterium]|nr:hypothetical protein [Candidatus Eisenbacteria bacterium]